MWGLLWRSRNSLDGPQEYLLWNLYRTRSAARAAAEMQYGYIRNRPDLRREPHGWRMPIPVKVELVRVKE